MARINLFGMDRDRLTEYFGELGVPAFHARQVYRWLYGRRQFDVGSWTDLPLSLRRQLGDAASVDPGRIDDRVEAADRTVKYRNGLTGGGHVESVFMEQAGRVTLCLSSQVGCAIGCDFCLTAKMGLVRNLDPGEIVGQVALIEQDRDLTDQRFNVVFMGMGEPLHNYDDTMGAVRFLTDPDGFGISRQRITISTSGLAPRIEALSREPVRPRLAVSLNATTDEVRRRLMPINRKYPIATLIEACRSFARETGDRFTFEYVLLAGVNDSDADSRRLARLIAGLPAKLNLIPFNPVPGWLDYQPPSRGRVLEFRDRLLEMGAASSIRWSRGADAQAACGQLALLPETNENQTTGDPE